MGLPQGTPVSPSSSPPNPGGRAPGCSTAGWAGPAAGGAVLLGVLVQELEPVPQPVPQVGQVLTRAGLCRTAGGGG